MNEKYKQIFKCEICKKVLPLEAFSNRKNGLGNKWICNDCLPIYKLKRKREIREWSKQYYEKTKGEL